MNQQLIKQKHILVLPRWYPNETDIQLGIFIQRQLILMQDKAEFTVVYVQPTTHLTANYKLITNHPANGLTEHIAYFKSNAGLFRKIINLWRFRQAQQLGLKQLETPIDLCHIHVPYRTALPALKLKRKKQIPFLITEHWSGHLNGLYAKKNGLDKLLYKFILKRAAKISTVSQSLSAAFKQNTGFSSEVIPNYIESSQPDLTQTQSAQIRLLFVGDFHDEIKNISGLIYAFNSAIKSIPNLHLTLVGGGPDEQKIKNLIQELGISNAHITLTGRKGHGFVLNCMTQCDIYICNSRHETFGMTVAEALMAGKPVICTRCGGPEEFLNETNSILINPAPIETNDHQTHQLVEAIKTLAANYPNYIGTEIRASVYSKFGKEAIQSKWLEFYAI